MFLLGMCISFFLLFVFFYSQSFLILTLFVSLSSYLLFYLHFPKDSWWAFLQMHICYLCIFSEMFISSAYSVNFGYFLPFTKEQWNSQVVLEFHSFCDFLIYGIIVFNTGIICSNFFNFLCYVQCNGNIYHILLILICVINVLSITF